MKGVKINFIQMNQAYYRGPGSGEENNYRRQSIYSGLKHTIDGNTHSIYIKVFS